MKKERDSNLELLRILMMFLIIAHHYVVNSDIVTLYDLHNITPNMVFYQLWGMWGRPAINVFILITGYFMCDAAYRWKRWFKVYLESKFYLYFFYIIFAIAGYEFLSAQGIFGMVFRFILGQQDNDFTWSFLMFYLLIPFLNMIVRSSTRRLHKQIIYLGILLFTVAELMGNSNTYFEVGWFSIVYLIGAYLKHHGGEWTGNNRIVGPLLGGTILLAWMAVLVIDFVGVPHGFESFYFLTGNCHRVLAITFAILVFLFFRNLKIGCNRGINTLASTTFGVFWIHTVSGAMRLFLWSDLLKLGEVYGKPLPYVILHAALSALVIFAVCAGIDLFRIRFLEKPLFAFFDRHENKIIHCKEKLYQIMGL